MQARATFDNQSSIRAFIVLIAAVVVALIVGGAGGYVVRVLAYSVPATTTTEIHRPFVIEQAPYSSPAASPAAEPTRDPKGFEVPI